ncbi:DUF84 family protein [Peribacillus sp. SCS-37]|uniref:DUF84 family protein n=1 Tax=Paraperibacillus esterisolvens TaxID=3115296 RepID=UPI0039061789
MKAAIGSHNPAKVGAVRDALGSILAEVIPKDVPSGVSEQPFTDEETIQGAINRAVGALKASGADIGFGLEGGVVQTERGVFVCNWGALATGDNGVIIAGGARIPLPVEVAGRLLAGEELGPVMEDFTKMKEIRKSEGAIGVFTNGRIKRNQMFAHIVEMLLGQWEYAEAEKGR